MQILKQTIQLEHKRLRIAIITIIITIAIIVGAVVVVVVVVFIALLPFTLVAVAKSNQLNESTTAMLAPTTAAS